MLKLAITTGFMVHLVAGHPQTVVLCFMSCEVSDYMLPFVCNERKLSSNVTLSIIEISDLTTEIKLAMDANFVLICEGNSGSDLQLVKTEVADLYRSKTRTWIMGATAEFFVHLYLTLVGFKQECLFLNLEERSIKKGFDGFYSHNGIEWLMESKSGSIATKDMCHSTKIKEAMLDLEDKVSGKTKNNPWRNAYSHASQYDVGTADLIRKNIKRLSDDFTQKRFYSINEFNTMPSATIFLAGIWSPKKHGDILNEVKTITSSLKGKQTHVICVTHNSVDIFLKYIGLR